MKVIDNFLDDEYFKSIQNYMMSPEIKWSFTDGINRPDDDNYQFVSMIYDDVDLYFMGTPHPFFQFMESLLHTLHVDLKKLIRIKANLNPKTIEHEHGGFHIDYKDVITSIFYINTNNGWTNFKNGDRVESVENRMVIFDSNLEHEGVTCTDEKRRVVINFNYVPA